MRKTTKILLGILAAVLVGALLYFFLGAGDGLQGRMSRFSFKATPSSFSTSDLAKPTAVPNIEYIDYVNNFTVSIEKPEAGEYEIGDTFEPIICWDYDIPVVLPKSKTITIKYDPFDYWKVHVEPSLVTSHGTYDLEEKDIYLDSYGEAMKSGAHHYCNNYKSNLDSLWDDYELTEYGDNAFWVHAQIVNADVKKIPESMLIPANSGPASTAGPVTMHVTAPYFPPYANVSLNSSSPSGARTFGSSDTVAIFDIEAEDNDVCFANAKFTIESFDSSLVVAETQEDIDSFDIRLKKFGTTIFDQVVNWDSSSSYLTVTLSSSDGSEFCVGEGNAETASLVMNTFEALHDQPSTDNPILPAMQGISDNAGNPINSNLPVPANVLMY